MEFIVFASIAAAVVCWAAGEAFRSRLWWTAGAVLGLVHALASFHVFFGWSHDAAREATTQQTLELTGLRFTGGIYVNYLFHTVWLADAAWWSIAPASYLARTPALAAATRAFIFFIVVNGAVVFADGWARGVGVAAVAVVIAAWIRRWRRGARIAPRLT